MQLNPVRFSQSLRRLALWFIGTLSLAAVAGCGPITLLNASSPSRHYDRQADIAYGANVRQRLDVYKPKKLDVPAPMVIFFYGGGWRDGDKAKYEFVASSLTAAGMVTVIPDYRLYPEVEFPVFVEDGARATAWAFENAERLGANTDQIFVMGHSAGAHIASLLAFDQRYLDAEDVTAQALAGFIGLSGPYDFLPIQRGYLENVFPESSRSESQPIRFVTASAPPSLLIHGTDDRTVLPKNSRNLAAKLGGAHVEVVAKYYEDVGHARVVAALAPPFDFLANTLNDTREFIKKTTAGSSRSMDPLAQSSR